MKELTRLRGYSDQMIEDANAVILTFGSYRLGVSSFFSEVPMNNINLIVLVVYASNKFNTDLEIVAKLFANYQLGRVSVLL